MIVTTHGPNKKVAVYDVPDSVLQQYAVTDDKGRRCFPKAQMRLVPKFPRALAQ